MKKLNQYIFKRRATKYLRHTTREKRWGDYNKVKTILLLFESDYIEKNRYIHKIIDALIADGKKVSTWGFLDKKTGNTAITPAFRILDRRAVNWTGCPKEPFINELKSHEYNLLLDLTLRDSLPLQYVCLYANATIKTGMSRMKNNILDFEIMIPPPDIEAHNSETEDKKSVEFKNLNETLFHTDQQFLYDQIMYYLKNVRSKD